MWQIFTQNSEGLAIQSTIGQEALAPEINFNQYIGEVNYIDYKKNIPFDDLFFSFSIQTEKFQYEGEVRILTDIGESTKINEGFKINVDINVLIEKYTFIPNLKTGIKICYSVSKTTGI
jgi:hypothetical protein